MESLKSRRLLDRTVDLQVIVTVQGILSFFIRAQRIVLGMIIRILMTILRPLKLGLKRLIKSSHSERRKTS